MKLEAIIKGLPSRDLVEGIRFTLETELWHKKKRLKEKPNIKHQVKAIEKALNDLEILEKRLREPMKQRNKKRRR